MLILLCAVGGDLLCTVVDRVGGGHRQSAEVRSVLPPAVGGCDRRLTGAEQSGR